MSALSQSPGGNWNRSVSRETHRSSSGGERYSGRGVLCRPLSQSPGKHYSQWRDLGHDGGREPSGRDRSVERLVHRSLSRNFDRHSYQPDRGRERDGQRDWRDVHRDGRIIGGTTSRERRSAEENVNRLLAEVSKFKQEEQIACNERTRSMSPKRMLRWKKNVKEHCDNGEMNKLLDEVGKFENWLNNREDRPKSGRDRTPVKFSLRPRSATPSRSSRDPTPATTSIIKQDCDRRYPTPPQKQDPPETLVIDARMKGVKHKKFSSQSSSATESTTLISSISGTTSFGDSNTESYDNYCHYHEANNNHDGKIDNIGVKRMVPNDEIVCSSENGAGVSQLGSVPSDSVKTDYILELLENQMNSLMFATDFIKEEFLKESSKNSARNERGVLEKVHGSEGNRMLECLNVIPSCNSLHQNIPCYSLNTNREKES